MTNTLTAPSQKRIILALLLVQVLFGINYSVAKIVVSSVPPLIWSGVRAFLTALLLLVICAKRPHPLKNSAFFRTVFFFSLIGVAINQACFLIGLRFTTASNAAILNTLIPVFAMVFIVLFGKERLTSTKTTGFVLALTGALVLLHVERLHLSDKSLLGDALMILNSMSYGLYLALSKNFLEKNDRLWVTFWQFLFGSMVLTLVATPDWMTAEAPVFTPALLAAMLFVILGGSFFPYILNNWAIAHTDASRVALYIYIQPVVASLVAILWFGESLTMRVIFGSACIFTGAYLTSKKPRAKLLSRP